MIADCHHKNTSFQPEVGHVVVPGLMPLSQKMKKCSHLAAVVIDLDLTAPNQITLFYFVHD